MRKRGFYLLTALVLVAAMLLAVPAFAADDETLTRGEFVTALYAQSDAADVAATQDSYDDVPAEGALAQAVRWATENGIVNGYGRRRFGPDDAVTREQMVTMLYRNAKLLGQDPRGEWMFPLGFSDAETVSAWADEAMQWAVMNRIIIGTGKALAPKATATDDQLSIVLDRWQSFLTPEGEDRGIIILYTSDVHCGVDMGFGYAGLWEAKNALIAQGYDVMLVDDGDSIRGETIGAATKGSAVMELMNLLGYDVATPGNHEFDYGMDVFLNLTEAADFPYISCNFVYEGETVFEPYVLLEIGGKKIGFVGVTTPRTITITTPGYFMNEKGEFIYGFLQDETGEGVYNAVQAAVDAVRAEGADYVVAMAHLGDEPECAPWTYEEVIGNTTGIDVMLDGHKHDTKQAAVPNAAGETVLRSACGTQMECIGWCSITPEGEFATGIYTWNREESAQEALGLDNALSRAIDEAYEGLNDLLSQVVAHSDVALTIYDPEAVNENGKPVRIVRRMETNLGDLCADAFRDQSGADIGIANGGGVRVSIAAGDITMNDILRVFPFGNSLCMVEATGQQILDALEWGSHGLPGESGGFLQVSGLSYEIRTDIESPCVTDLNGMFVGVEGERRVQNVLVGGEPIDPERTYTLASHDFMLLNSGDGFTMFRDSPLLLDCVKEDNQLLIDYIVETLGGDIGEEYANPYGQGRITVLD